MVRQVCTLCGKGSSPWFGRSAFYDFFQCSECGLLFADPKQHPDPESERERYLTHNNSWESLKYRAYLSRVFDDVRPYFKGLMRILDYGCGKEGVLPRMLREMGFEAEGYDPVFDMGVSTPLKEWDGIIVCETMEHFREPGKEIKRIKESLSEKGVLALKTGFYDNEVDLSEWWYARDFTHLAFYNRSTIEYIAAYLKKTLVYYNCKDIAVIR